jgi:pimeloyl-ACP methyl ester carboxylesterase
MRRSVLLGFLLILAVTGSAAPRSGFATVNGVKLHYLEWGDTRGEALLLLAGLGNDASIFETFAPKLADRFHVHALTRRGFGASDKPASGYDVATRVEDIRGFLDARGIRRVSLIGHSLAGDELTAFATAYPQRVRKVVYLDAAYNRAKTSVFWLRGKMLKGALAYRVDYRGVRAPALAFIASRFFRSSSLRAPGCVCGVARGGRRKSFRPRGRRSNSSAVKRRGGKSSRCPTPSTTCFSG